MTHSNTCARSRQLLSALAGALLPAAVCSAAPHDLDTSFRGTGYSSLTFAGQSSKVNAMAVQPDGKIVVVGILQSTASSRGLVLARLLANGALDTGFGSGGVTGFFPTESNAIECAAVVIQTDGKILVGGSRFTSATGWDFQVVRYLANGQTDTGFGNAGFVSVNSTGGADDFLTALVLQPDGKIIAAGRRRINGLFGISDVFLTRHLANGAIDTSFGSSGRVAPARVNNSDGAWTPGAVALRPDGKLVVAGSLRVGGLNSNFYITRYTAAGAVDTTFGTEGEVVKGYVNGYHYANGVALQADGRVLVSGDAWAAQTVDSRHYFGAIRLLENGGEDTSYGDAGFGGGTFRVFDDEVNVAGGCVLQADGKLVIVTKSTTQGRGWFGTLRYTTSGLLDSTFGNGGRWLQGLTNGTDESVCIALQPDGKILTAGCDGPVNAGQFSVMRQLGDPTAPVALPAWRQTHFSTTANSGNAADTADPDSDGVKNLVEYAFGMNPKSADAHVLPKPVRTSTDFSYTLPQPASVTGITYRVESGTTPAAMTAVTDTGSGLSHFFTVPTAGRPRQFLRIKITTP